MRVRERFDHSYFGTGLRSDDDLDATFMEILNSTQRTRWIMLRIANKESVSDRVILRMDVFEIAAAIRNAATVFLPSENPDPVNVASTPIFTAFAGNQ